MNVFSLKYRDTRPILEVVLHDPAPADSAPGALGPVHDLTGSTAWTLHIYLSDGSALSRSMTLIGAPTDGTLRYAWTESDWDVDNPAGFLTVSPPLPLRPGIREHLMEVEVLGAAGVRMTFPNGGDSITQAYDVLRIWEDLGQS